MKKNRWGKVYLAVVFIVLYAPIFYLMFYSFNAGGTMNSFSGFTLDYYKEVFQDTRLLIIVLNTFVIALLSSVIATIFGVLGALAIRYMPRPFTKKFLAQLKQRVDC